MNDKFTIRQFQERFPTDEACLEEIKVLKYGERLECPKCEKENKFHKLNGRMAYSCDYCRYQLYPLKGTIFEKSTTPLRDWMYAIYLMAQTRAGISAKQLERELGCTYKTAWRMFHQIRTLMADNSGTLSGEVEVDETYIGRDPFKRRSTGKPRDSQIVFGVVERGGRARARHVKSAGSRVLLPEIQKGIEPGSIVYSEEAKVYTNLPKLGYKWGSIKHQAGVYVDGQVHTQNIENLWSNMKRGIRGVYRHVDAKYLQAYVDEYAFRYSNRDNPRMFDAILSRLV